MASNPCVEVKLTSGSKYVLLANYRDEPPWYSVPVKEQGLANINKVNLYHTVQTWQTIAYTKYLTGADNVLDLLCNLERLPCDSYREQTSVSSNIYFQKPLRQ